MSLHPDTLAAVLREHIFDLLFGPIFVFLGLAACSIAALRRRSDSQLLVWFGLFIGLYGIRMLAVILVLVPLAPGSPWPSRIEIGVDYVLVIPSLLFWSEVSKDGLKRVLRGLALVAATIAVFGLAWFALTGNPYTFIGFNFVIAISATVLVGALVGYPPFVRRYLLIRSRVLRFVMPALAVIVLGVNVMFLFGREPPRYAEPVGFAVWIFAIGYEAARHMLDNERRLVSIDSELETARQIQAAILPDRAPLITGCRIAATYQPSSAVAGDFYEFLLFDEYRFGILIADVTGHGVPAALIASMIKVAMKSAGRHASEPDQVLSNLNRILTPELNGRLTSAACLWLDTESKRARYSAAGHPPLLHWREGAQKLESVESNGLLFGIASNCVYPVRELSLEAGDRLLTYTDGLIEPENSHGESFGEARLQRLISDGAYLTAEELTRKLMAELGEWQPRSLPQQDDITLVAIDIL